MARAAPLWAVRGGCTAPRAWPALGGLGTVLPAPAQHLSDRFLNVELAAIGGCNNASSISNACR